MQAHPLAQDAGLISTSRRVGVDVGVQSAAPRMLAVVFGVTTIATMLGSVMVSFYGLSKLSLPQAERYSHALAGLTVLLCGGAIKLLGL